MNLLHPCWAEINLNNIIYNMNNIKNYAQNSTVVGVVKADAYGHGAVEIATTMINNGIKKLAVANIVEAIELREQHINVPIMILGISIDTAIQSILKYNIEPTVSSYEFAYKLNQEALRNKEYTTINIALDTGMGRIGFRPSNESIDEIRKIYNLSNIKVASVFSHFSTADAEDKEYSNYQLTNYNWFINKLNEYDINIESKNLANSAAIIDLPNSHFDIVRPGIIQYGYYPSSEVKKELLPIRPVLTWKTQVVHVKEIDANEFIGYGKNFKTNRKSIIATIPVGYADGYSRGLSNKGKVLINGFLAPIVGNVCMDQFMVDITDIPNVKLGDEVILLGSDNNVKFDADDMAELLNTISYEILCNIGKRVPRIYIK